MTGASSGCFVDTMRPVTEAEKAAWKVYLSLHRDHWRAARGMFRRVHSGMLGTTAVLGFVSDTGITDLALLDKLETVLKDLMEEKAR